MTFLTCSNCRRNVCRTPDSGAIGGVIAIWCETCKGDPHWFDLTKQEQRFLDFLSDSKERTCEDIAKAMFFSLGFVRRTLLELYRKGLLERGGKKMASGQTALTYRWNGERIPHDERVSRGHINDAEVRRG